MLGGTWHLCLVVMWQQYVIGSADMYMCLQRYCKGDDSVAPIINEIRNRPMVPKPSLRSQAKQNAWFFNGQRPLTSNQEVCEDNFRLLLREDKLKELQLMADATMKGYNDSENFSLLMSLTPISAIIYVDGYQHGLHTVDSDSYDGQLSLGVVHPATGAMVREHHCNPHNINANQYLASWLAELPHGYIIVIAINAYRVPESLRSFLSTLDAHPPMAPPNMGDGRIVWAWVGRWGGGAPMKELGGWIPVKQLRNDEKYPPLLAEVYIPRSPAERWCKDLAKPQEVPKAVWDARVKLCSDFAGYGTFCECPPNYSINADKTNKEVDQQLQQLQDAVTVITAHRPTLLNKLLETVLSSPGGNSGRTLVFTPEITPELQLVCDAHGVSIYATDRYSDCEGLQSLHLYQAALFMALVLRPRAEFIITLEDDMLITDGFYKWMIQARAELIISDKYICANSIAEHPNANLTDNPKDEKIMEISPKATFFSAGWAASREVVEFMLGDWPLAKVDTPWDFWLQHWTGEVVPNWPPCISPITSVARHASESSHYLIQLI
ncbi:unnamed protein product [Meganyctiphanes norvegica]|uniref:Uncharacterized protein n=1 Tax=Meganyctiphanes norvegica TaxID=48144 RepID=A0AAV2RYT7_MEGNR